MQSSGYTSRQRFGLFTGLPIFFILLLLPTPDGMPIAAHKTLAVTFLMAFWWITEALPIPATSLLPLILFPFLNVDTAQNIGHQYGDRNIFLFMGGFFIAIAIERCGLHKRIALKVVSLLGTSPKRIILGMMVATAFLSMWISNTATAMMMLPIAVALVKHAEDLGNDGENSNIILFRTALLFGIGYAASIGGIGTLIGTPPNIIFAAQVQTLFPNAPEISFFKWFTVGLPLVIVFLPIAWLYLTKFAFPVTIPTLPGGRAVIQDRLNELGRMSKDEKYVLTVFIMTALGWIFRRSIDLGFMTIIGWSDLLGIADKVHDSTVAIFGAILLFFIPSNLKTGKFLLDWKSAIKIPWGILLLYGGGLALALEFKNSGLVEWIGSNMTFLKVVPIFVAVALVILIMDFLTEVTSNTAITSIFLPVLAVISIGMEVHPYLLMIAGTIAASLAFMLPIATPPNAVIFSSGYLTIPQMVRTGFAMNIIGMFVTLFIMYALAIKIFGITVNELPIWAM